jgi:FHA domain
MQQECVALESEESFVRKKLNSRYFLCYSGLCRASLRRAGLGMEIDEGGQPNPRERIPMKLSLLSDRPWNEVDEIRIDHYPCVLGRDRDSDYSVQLSFISRRHCRFLLQDGRVVVHDLESFNGTFVNGSRIAAPTAITDGDELRLGPMSFRVRLRTEVEETVLDDQRRSGTRKIPALAGGNPTGGASESWPIA